jgi:hypothetical protein
MKRMNIDVRVNSLVTQEFRVTTEQEEFMRISKKLKSMMFMGCQI